METRDVGILVAGAGLTLFERTTLRASLEDAFLELTRDHGDFRAGSRADPAAGAGHPALDRASAA